MKKNLPKRKKNNDWPKIMKRGLQFNGAFFFLEEKCTYNNLCKSFVTPFNTAYPESKNIIAMKYFLLLSILSGTCISLAAQKNPSVTFEEWISLKQAGGVLISPNGKCVVYNVTGTDWKENSYDTEIWLYKEGGKAFQLTRTAKGSSFGARFSPDSKWITFLADRGDKTQIHIISADGGEAIQVTKEEEGIGTYEWSPDGKWIAFTKQEPESKTFKTTKDRYGAFGVEGEEYRLSHLWMVKFDYDSLLAADRLPCYSNKPDSTSIQKSSLCFSLPKPTRLTEGNFTVNGFRWNPDGNTIILNKQPDPLINSSVHSDIAIIDPKTKKLEVLVNNPSGDFIEAWSPDGKQFIYNSSGSDTTTFYYKNDRLFIYDLQSKTNREVALNFDEDKNVFEWNSKGIFFNAAQKTKSGIFRINPSDGTVTPLPISIDIPGAISFSKDGSLIALNGRNSDGLTEIFLLKEDNNLQKITNMTAQITGWNTPVNEVIEWKSKDGTMIEGVLLKPRNYDQGKKYPLLVVIHGGPTGVDRPDPVPSYVYPIMQWCEKGALVLRVNYRGSAGYGEKFRVLNVRNLGVGDMWDVVSGVEHLQKKGMIDTSRLGCMGWSQGGYISAFLTTNTTMFKAISVGAGISNWVTYYVNTDITPFTRQYLRATPWNDMNIYLKTSPMTNIIKASTPTLIQHGEFDKRVPIPNAYELYRGLQDRGIPSRLIVYKGFGHGINKPKERLAAIWHNWQWFNRYIWNEEVKMPAD